MNKILNFLYRLECFFSSLFETYWVNLDTGIKGAIIGASIALIGIFVDNSLQRTREKENQINTERGKLIYLNILIRGIYPIIKEYNRNADNLDRALKDNPFRLPEYTSSPTSSLDIIINKINQEEYHLALIRQLKREDVGEIFLIYNALDRQIKDSGEHYRNEFPNSRQFKQDYFDSFNSLKNSVLDYLKTTNTSKLSRSQLALYSQLSQLQNFYNSSIVYSDSDVFISRSYNEYLLKLITILEANSLIPITQKLLLLSYSSDQNYKKCESQIKHVVEYVLFNRDQINFEIAEIKRIVKPLEDYINNLPKLEGQK